MGKANQQAKKGVAAAAAGKKSKIKMAASNNKKITKANAASTVLGSGNDLGWKSIYTLNAKQEETSSMQRGALSAKRGNRLSISSWDFDHLKGTVQDLKQRHKNTGQWHHHSC